MVFNNSEWIWPKNEAGKDEYAEFYAEFEACGKTVVRISADSDYTLYINGKYLASNQYGDYEHYKIYDEIDATSLINSGKNSISVLVWHFGENTSRYKKATAGLIFEIVSDGNTVLNSSECVKARISPTYESGRAKLITGQLGYGFAYDATKEDGALFCGAGFENSVKVEKECKFYPRPIKKQELAPIKKGIVTASVDKKHHLIDLPEETVGLLAFAFNTENAQNIRIDWGEDLQGGHVRRIIGERDFSIDYKAKAGKNEYVNYMLRFGARFIEIWSEEPIELEYAGLIPQYYPTELKGASLLSELDTRIYELCRTTLKLSMMEHYVDCPWREQALYAFDSRNQMLSGYYAFKGGNAEYARANLKLISEDERYNSLLSICYPTGKKLAIPSFSLHYFKAVWEYYEHTKDSSLLREVYQKLSAIAKTFVGNIENGLVNIFTGDDHWSFYDWSDYLDGDRKNPLPKAPDALINFLFASALLAFENISAVLGEKFAYEGLREEILKNAKRAFYNEDSGLISFREGDEKYTELANALAITSGAVTGDEAKRICEAIISGKTTECSLSVKCFTYDALYATDEKYKDFILGEIRRNYGFMLDSGATSAWETIKGAEDFGNAGSLCHGWSAIPVYYYHKFGMVE